MHGDRRRVRRHRTPVHPEARRDRREDARRRTEHEREARTSRAPHEGRHAAGFARLAAVSTRRGQRVVLGRCGGEVHRVDAVGSVGMERDQEIPRRLEPPRALATERPQHHGVEARGHVAVERPGRRRRSAASHHLEEQLALAGALVREFLGQRLVEHHADGEEVRAVIDVATPHPLLGSHVRRGADGHALLRRVHRVGLAALELRHAEVEELHRHIAALVDEEHVVRLEVAVNDALGVRRRERRQHLPDDHARLVRSERGAAGDALAQRLAAQKLHHQEGLVLGEPGVEDLDDVLVADFRGRACLAGEAPHRLGHPCEVRVEHLDRHVPPHGEVLGLVDGPHASLAQQANDAIAAVELRSGSEHARQSTTRSARGTHHCNSAWPRCRRRRRLRSCAGPA